MANKLLLMEKRIMFSIVLATYNCGSKVENTLQSIFSNNRELYELIVVDGASEDDTLSVLRKYEDQMTILSEKDEGIYDAFNKGITKSSGKYLYFIGAGDCLRPGILEEVLKHLPQTTPSLVYGNCYFTKQKILNGKEFTAITFIRDNLCQQGIFYDRNLFKLIGKFDLTYKLFADWFFNLKCFLNSAVTTKYLDIIIADYEENGLSSYINNDPQFKKDFPRFVKKQFGTYAYFVCKAFLAEPVTFNLIYLSEYRWLWEHLISNYKLPRNMYLIAKPGYHKYRQMIKTIRTKI